MRSKKRGIEPVRPGAVSTTLLTSRKELNPPSRRHALKGGARPGLLLQIHTPRFYAFGSRAPQLLSRIVLQ